MCYPPKLILNQSKLSIEIKNAKTSTGQIIYDIKEEVIFKKHIVNLVGRKNADIKIKLEELP